MKFKTIVIILVLLIVYVVAKGFVTGELTHDYSKELADLNAKPTPTKINNNISIEVDLNGDGTKDKLVVTESTQSATIKEMAAATSDGKLIGILPDGMSIPFPYKDSLKIIKLNSDDKNEFVSMESAIGPHQGLTFILGLMNDGRILPVCKTLNPKQLIDCSFWDGEVGQLQFADLDGDKNIEVVEYVDEYPTNGSLSTDELKAFGDAQDNKTYQATMMRIAKRENGGRGRKVVWAIYKYDNGFFKEMTGKNYDKFYQLAVASNYQSSPIKKSQMSQASIDFNEFVYKVWTGQKVD